MLAESFSGARNEVNSPGTSLLIVTVYTDELRLLTDTGKFAKGFWDLWDWSAAQRRGRILMAQRTDMGGEYSDAAICMLVWVSLRKPMYGRLGPQSFLWAVMDSC